ncbi:hypothetical protein Tco_0334396, partial [Tanacetum coccineum]
MCILHLSIQYCKDSTVKTVLLRERIRLSLRQLEPCLQIHFYQLNSGLKQYILACYVLNRVLVTKPQMKTPYELLMGKPQMKTPLNTMDHLSKFEGKSEEGYLLGYSTNSKGFRVYNRVTRKVQDCLHVDFLEGQMNQKGK